MYFLIWAMLCNSPAKIEVQNHEGLCEVMAVARGGSAVGYSTDDNSPVLNENHSWRWDNERERLHVLKDANCKNLEPPLKRPKEGA